MVYLFQFTQLSQYSNMGFSLAFNVGFAMAFVSSFYVLFYVRERVTNSKHLQFVSGVDVSSFWSVSFVCDLITFIVTSVCLLITLVAFQENGFNTAADLGITLSWRKINHCNLLLFQDVCSCCSCYLVIQCYRCNSLHRICSVYLRLDSRGCPCLVYLPGWRPS